MIISDHASSRMSQNPQPVRINQIGSQGTKFWRCLESCNLKKNYNQEEDTLVRHSGIHSLIPQTATKLTNGIKRLHVVTYLVSEF